MAKKKAKRKRSGDIRVPTTVTNYDVTYKGPPSYRPPSYPKPLIETNAFIFEPKDEPWRHERIGRPTPSRYYNDHSGPSTTTSTTSTTRPPRPPSSPTGTPDVAPPATPIPGKKPRTTG